MINFLNVSKQSKLLKVLAAAAVAVLIAIAIAGCAPSEYSSDLKAPVLKKPDIIQNGVLKVGLDFGNPPLAGESSKASGIDVDVASAVAEELGLEVEFVDVGSGAEVALTNKKVDIVMGISSASSSEKIWKSEAYLKTANAIFTRNSNEKAPSAEAPEKISAQMGSQSAIAAQTQFGAANVALENNVSKCFEKLNNNEIKYVAADAVVGSYYAKSDDVSTSIIALLSKPSGYCIGVNADNKNLSEKIKNALETIAKGGITSVIEKKWLGKSLDLDKVSLTSGATSETNVAGGEAGVYGQATTENQQTTNQ